MRHSPSTSHPRGPTASRRIRAGAFTLIEVLVVVGIIALLVAILVPSLSRARTQARLGVCKSNLKQIGNMIGAYQGIEVGAVPVLLNYYAWGYNKTDPATGQDTHPARVLRPSVALRMYDGRPKLPERFNPEKSWDQATRADYEKTSMPDLYSCPLSTGTGSESLIQIGTKLVTGSGSPATYTTWEWRGRHEAYHPWLWEEIVRNEKVRGDQELHPNDPVDGRPKYSVLTWNRVLIQNNPAVPPISGAVSVENPNIKNMHRKWSAAEARTRKSASLADVTVLYCAQGNFLAFEHHINNPDSHRTSAGAGTNALFGDTHVEWVPGTHIGWP